MTYDRNLAQIYDLLYQGSGKDYAAEAAAITALIRQWHPHADSLLDVGCGTGLHLAGFATMFTRADGIDFSADMLSVAATRVPATVTLAQADMRTLHLPSRYDCATVLFSAIGYMAGETELRQAIAAIAAHLEPGGVLLIEPWFTPDQWQPGTIHETRYQDEHRTVVRMAYSSSTGSQSTMDMHYLLGEKDSGITYWRDQHVLTLFSKTEYENAMTACGLTEVAWVPGWAQGRDRIIASKPGRPA